MVKHEYADHVAAAALAAIVGAGYARGMSVGEVNAAIEFASGLGDAFAEERYPSAGESPVPSTHHFPPRYVGPDDKGKLVRDELCTCTRLAVPHLHVTPGDAL